MREAASTSPNVLAKHWPSPEHTATPLVLRSNRTLVTHSSSASAKQNENHSLLGRERAVGVVLFACILHSL